MKKIVLSVESETAQAVPAPVQPADDVLVCPEWTEGGTVHPSECQSQEQHNDASGSAPSEYFQEMEERRHKLDSRKCLHQPERQDPRHIEKQERRRHKHRQRHDHPHSFEIPQTHRVRR